MAKCNPNSKFSDQQFRFTIGGCHEFQEAVRGKKTTHTCYRHSIYRHVLAGSFYEYWSTFGNSAEISSPQHNGDRSC